MAIRNYGPIGCLLSLLLVAIVVGALVWIFQGRLSSGPPQDRIMAAAEVLIRQAIPDATVSSLDIKSLHPQRDRWAWTVKRWAITGDIAYTDQTSTVEDDFIAVIRTVCDRYSDWSCWSLSKLSVAGAVYGDQIKPPKQDQ